jgi:hypothetical protein
MSNRRARVLAAYATVKILDPVSGKWTVAGFYQGAVLPPEADPENVASLVRREYAEWLDSDEASAVDKAETEADKAAEDAAKQQMDEAEAAAVKADEDAEKAAAKAAEDADKTAEPEAESEAEPEAEPEAELDLPPAQSAPKPDWVAYAVSQRDEGVSEEDARAEAEAKTKAELIVEYGG